MDMWAKVLSNQKEVTGVLVVHAEESRLQEEIKRRGWHIPVIADDGSIAKVLSPRFSPQAFGFARGRLVWIQETPGTPEKDLFTEFCNRQGKGYG
ncbi:MAG: hypothetical protein HPY54_13655 [Chthonomonadetes bacterium]|nr:hypothetical protein [Chthonomonadetes bacterium]